MESEINRLSLRFVILKKIVVPYTVYTEASAIDSKNQANLDKVKLTTDDATKIEKWIKELWYETACMK